MPRFRKPSWLNASYRKVGGIRFLRLGRITITACVSAGYRPIKPPMPRLESKAPPVPKGWREVEGGGWAGPVRAWDDIAIPPIPRRIVH